MKALVTIVILLGLVWLIFAPAAAKYRRAVVSAVAAARPSGNAQSATSSDGGKAGEGATSDSIRKFELTLLNLRPGGLGVATGTYYDVPPSVTTFPERLESSKANWTQATRIFVSGLPGGLIDGQNWTGWLAPDGTKTYNETTTGNHTVAAYRVVPSPPPLEYRAPPGSWMQDTGRTSLDHRAR